jgi:peptide chain release factor 1
MLEKLKLVEERYMEMEARAAQPDLYADPAAAAKLLKEQRQLEPVVTAYRAYKKTEQELPALLDAARDETDEEMKQFCQDEYAAGKKRLAELEQELKILLLPRDPNDEKSVIMELRGGVGGEESALFAHSLFRMYTMYAESKGWTVELLNYNETELGGVKEADFMIQGDGAFSRLKFESGVHRVQRVPETESGGRVHTSTATVAVLPEFEEAEIDIRPEDIEMQVYRSSGAGGQHINKTSSAVRLIHKPSGIVVNCQEERSQVQNRAKCMQMLASKLRAGACPRRDLLGGIVFPCRGGGPPGLPGGICRLVHPSGGRFFPFVRKESEERHAKGKGFDTAPKLKYISIWERPAAPCCVLCFQHKTRPTRIHIKTGFLF